MIAGHVLLAALLAGPPAARAPPRPPAQRSAGSVAGTLRHKGCTSPAAGARVSVIGRDAVATADAAGRFSLALAPGTYSLIISGPNLVSDQRVDEVEVTLGQTRDLGTVEVWPEERPAGCGAAAPPQPAEAAVVAAVPDTPSLDLPGDAVAKAQAGPYQLWVRGPEGSGPGQFGLQGDPARGDEDALGPPSFAVGPHGTLWVLDALNGRVVRFDAQGKAAGGFFMGRRGEEPVVEADIAVSEDGHVWVFHEGEVPVLHEYDPSGRLLVGGALPTPFKGAGLLFVSRQRPVLLMQNGQAVRAEAGWGGVRAEGPLPGLPAGDFFVRVERVDRWRAAVKLSTADGRVRRSVQLRSRVPVVGVRLVGVDRKGDVVVAVDRTSTGDESAPQAEVLLLSVTPQGRLTGAASVPPGDRRFEFREFALGPDGGVVQMQSDAAEVRFVRWALGVPPKEFVAGEGLVRGRVTEGGRPRANATVTVGRLRRAVPVAPDGSFEVRLPAGTYVLSVRCAPAGGAPDLAALEIKVAVAAGSTLDLGSVALPQRQPPRASDEPLPQARPAPAPRTHP